MDAQVAIFFAGEKKFASPRKILVPMDFSEPSIRALKMALRLKEKDFNIQVEAINVVCPSGVSPEIGLSYANVLHMLKERSSEAYQSMLEQNKINPELVRFHIEVCKDINVARCLSAYSEKQDYELIITGATGHSNLDSFLFGSVTESLAQQVSKASILVVR